MFIRPTFRLTRVEDITVERLHDWRIRALLLDVDCTLTRYKHRETEPGVAAWLEEVRSAGIALCLVSNGLSQRIHEFAEQLKLPCVSRALKPLPTGIWEAMRRLNVERSETAMVGDQLFADILAGRFAGVRTILVDAIHPEEEPWYTQLKRGPERWFLRWIRKHSVAPSADEDADTAKP